MSRFGRKGVGSGPPVARTAGITPPRTPQVFTPASEPDDGLSPAARAFIAAERARNLEEVSPPDPMERVVAASPSAMRFTPRKTRPERSLLLAYVYWWFSGVIGAHRFYLGAYRSGAAMPALFFGGLLIMLITPLPGVAMICICVGWNVMDAFLIPGMHRRYCADRRSMEIASVFS